MLGSSSAYFHIFLKGDVVRLNGYHRVYGMMVDILICLQSPLGHWTSLY